MAGRSPSHSSPAGETVGPMHDSSTWQRAFKGYRSWSPDSYDRLIRLCPAFALDSHSNAIFAGDPVALVRNVAEEVQSMKRDLAQSTRTEQERSELAKSHIIEHTLYMLSVHAEVVATAPSFDAYAAAAVGVAAAVLSQTASCIFTSGHVWDALARNVHLILTYGRHDLDHQSDETLRYDTSLMYYHILRHMSAVYENVRTFEHATRYNQAAIGWNLQEQHIKKVDESCRSRIESILQAENNKIEKVEKKFFRHQVDRHLRINAALRTAGISRLVVDLRMLHGLPLAVIPKRAPRTCDWFTCHPDFIRWRHKDCSSLLYFCADPGAGKTVLCKYLTQQGGSHLASRKKGQILLCSYFFDQDSHHEGVKSPELISSLVHQLLVQVPQLCQSFMRLTGRFDTLDPDQTALWLILLALIRDSEHLDGREIICVIDGVDILRHGSDENLLLSIREYFQTADEQWQDELRPGAVLKMLITSRPSAEMPDAFTTFVKRKSTLPQGPRIRFIGGLATFDNAGTSPTDVGKRERDCLENDVERATDIIVEHKGSLLGISDVERNKMKRKLRNRTYQSYHASHAALDSMLDNHRSLQKSGSNMEKSLQIAEVKGSSFSSDAYVAVLNNSSAHRDRMVKLLRLVLAAQRPLTVREAHFALALDGEHSSYESLNEMSHIGTAWDLRSIGGMFVDIRNDQLHPSYHLRRFLETVDAEVVNESHAKYQQAFQWSANFSKRRCHLELVNVCIGLLNFTEDVERFGNLPRELRGDAVGDIGGQTHFQSEPGFTGERFLLMAYAFNNVAHHCKEADGLLGADLCRLVCDTLCNASSPARSLWTVPKRRNEEADFPPKSNYEALLFARIGLLEGMRLEQDAGISLSARTSGSSRRPIDEAAIGGQQEVVTFLLHEIYCEPLEMVYELSRMSLSPLWEACYAANADIALTLMVHHPLWMHKPMQGLSPIFALMLSPEPDIAVFARLYQHDHNCHCQEDYLTAVQFLEISGTPHDNHFVFGPMDAACLTTLLILASARGILEIVKLLLSTPGATVNGSGDEQKLGLAFELAGISTTWLEGGRSTALLWAVRGNHGSVCKALMAAGADVNKSSGTEGVFPLYVAALGRSNSLLSRLSKKDLNFSQAGGLHKTALRAAIVADVDELRPWLPKSGIIPSEGEDSNLMHLAVRYGRLGMLRVLLDCAADFNARGEDGSTPLYAAAFHRPNGTDSEDMFDFLLQIGCDPNLEGGYFGFPLQVAALYGDTSRVTALLDAGAFVNAYGGAHSTALHAACFNMHIDTVRLLISRGANPKTPDVKGRTCLLVSIKARETLDKASDSDALFTEASSTTANSIGQVEILVEMLLAAGVDNNARDHEDETPLLAAINEGKYIDSTLVRRLLAARADVNHVTPSGMTALRRACIAGSRDLVHLLYQHGAEPDLRHHSERSPLEEAVMRGHEGIACDLISFGANIDAPDAEGRTMLETAVRNGNVQAARFLLLRGAVIELLKLPLREGRSENSVSPEMMELIHELRPELRPELAGPAGNLAT